MRKKLLQGTALGAGTLIALTMLGPLARAADDCGVAAPGSSMACNAGTQTDSFTDADGITYGVADLTVTLDAGETAEHVKLGGVGNFGDLAIVNNGTISQTATSAATADAGLAARSDDGSVTIGNYGSISTVTDNVEGISGWSQGGAVTVTSTGDVDTAGNGAIAIRAYSSAGDVSITSSGEVTTSGTGASGIHATSTVGAVYLDVTGDVTVQNGSSFGVLGRATTYLSATIDSLVTTTNTASAAVSLQASAGDLSADFLGTIDATGNDATGIAVAAYGNVDLLIDGTITTQGDDAFAVFSNGDLGGSMAPRTNSVTVTADSTIATQGVNADGLFVTGGANATVEAAVYGSITTDGQDSEAIILTSQGTVDLTLAGTVSASGNGSNAVFLSGIQGASFSMTGGSIYTNGVNAGAVEVTGNSGAAEIALTGGTIDTVQNTSSGATLTSNSADLSQVYSIIDIATAGNSSHGISTRTGPGGLLALVGGTIQTTGMFSHGIEATSIHVGADSAEGALDIRLAGTVDTDESLAHGMQIATVTSDVSVTLYSGSSIQTDGDNAHGINAFSESGDIAVTNGGTVDSGGTAIRLTSGGQMVLNNLGSLTSDTDRLVRAFGSGSFDGQNSGSMTGFLELTGQGDSLTNAAGGTWTLQDRNGATATSAFGGGDDLFVNAGLFELGDWQAGAEAGVLSGLETFRNSGLVSLADGEAGDTLTTAGDYVGMGGMLALDVVIGDDLSPADRIVIEGDASGTTSLLITNLGGLGGETVDGILLIDVGGTSSDDAFSLAGGPLVVGSFTYDLLEREEDWYLINAPLPEVLPTVEAAHIAIGTWHAGLRALDERMGSLRHLQRGDGHTMGQTAALGAGDAQTAFRPAAEPMPSGLWGRVNLENIDSDPSGGMAYEQQTQILQVGGDIGFRDLLLGDDLFILGGSAAIVSGKAKFDGLSSAQDLEGWSAALYATWMWEGAYLDLVGKIDGYEIQHTAGSVGLDAAQDAWVYGVSLEAGYQFWMDDVFFVEPEFQIAYANATFDDVTLLGGDVATFEDSDSLRLRGGLRAGGRLEVGGATLMPYVEASYVHELLGDAHTTLVTTPLHSSTEGGYAEFGAGVAVADLGDHLSLHVDADYIVGDRVEGLQATFGVRVSW